MTEAVELLHPKTAVDESAADDAIRSAVADYRRTAAQGLRWGNVRRELRDIARLAERLRRALGAASALTVSRLGSVSPLGELLRRIDQGSSSGPSASPWQYEYEDGAAGSEFIALLDRVVKTAESVAEETFTGPGQQAEVPEPAHARRELVRDCLRIFEKFRPGKAVTTEEGDFRRFVSLVWEVATGEGDVDLIRVIRQVIREHRHRGT